MFGQHLRPRPWSPIRYKTNDVFWQSRHTPASPAATKRGICRSWQFTGLCAIDLGRSVSGRLTGVAQWLCRTAPGFPPRVRGLE